MAQGLAYHLGKIGSESILDGTVIAADIADGTITGVKFAAGAVSGAAILAGACSGAKIASGGIATVHFAASACSGTAVSNTFAPIGTGSPVSYGLSMQTGSAVLGAGSDVWLSFPKPFAASPVSVMTQAKTTAGNNDLWVGSFSAGSCYIAGKTASEALYWLAVGSGR